MTSPSKWFVTFMGNNSKRNQYWLVEGEYAAARQKTFDRWGPKWAFIYPIEELDGQVSQFGLTEYVDEPGEPFNPLDHEQTR